MIVITAGKKYVDIDALACAVAYQELLELEGKDSVVVFPGLLNHSVSQMVQSQNFSVSKKLPNNIYGFVVVDVSEPTHISDFVEPKKVIEIYDHHYGFVDFWEKTIKPENVHIEMIGACATLIWEEYKKRGFSEKISTSSANLLSLAIISNTFDLTSPLTDKRDVNAFEELNTYSDLPENWKKQYYAEQERFIFDNPTKAIVDDTKIQKVPVFEQPLVIGQIELWDGSSFIDNYLDNIREGLSQYNNSYWMINVPSISERKNYIYSENEDVQKTLEKAIGCSFNGNLCVTDKLILRKEILKSLYNSEN